VNFVFTVLSTKVLTVRRRSDQLLVSEVLVFFCDDFFGSVFAILLI